MDAESKVNILLVDDRPENLVALESVLTCLGQNLVKAQSGKEALKHLLKDEFAVILLDVQMPEMDGFETATLIREREKLQQTPIVFLTAINKSDTHVSRGYSIGAVDYMFKPFDPEVLRAKVCAFVELAKKTRDLQAQIAQRKRAEEEILRLNAQLERRVLERTGQLEQANQELQTEIQERRRAEQERRQLLKREQEARRAAEAAQQRVQEADRRKDEFLAMLAHELRNPLAAISNADYALGEITSHDPNVTRLQAVISRQVRNLSRLVDDLLDVSRISHGQIELRSEVVDLASVVQRSVEATGPLIEAQGHQLAVSLPSGSVCVEADPTRLEQVLSNLLHNAAKYTPPGGQILLTVEGPLTPDAAACREAGRDGSAAEDSGESLWAVIRVKDTGVGIPPTLMPHVFELFAQAERSLDRSQGGLGIGLALVKRLVQLHGGTVEGQSEGQDRGSEFIVRLPALPSASTAPMLDIPSAPPRQKSRGGGGARITRKARARKPAAAFSQARRVLIVEDNPDAAETLADIVKMWGHDVRLAKDGPSGIEEAKIYLPQVVLLDIGLPEMDGYEVARQIRQQKSLAGTLLVALTGYGQDENRRLSHEAGFDVHLTKPVNPADLQQLLQNSPIRAG